VGAVVKKWRRYRRVHEADVEGAMRDELGFHLEMRAESLRTSGLDADAARREAERRMGDVEGVLARCRSEAERTWRRRRTDEVMLTTMREVVQAVRGLRRRPLFFAAAVATLGLGIGATTAVYSMVDAVLLAPLPYDEPDELVEIRTIDGEGEKELFPRAALESLEETGPSYAGLAAWGAVRGSSAVRASRRRSISCVRSMICSTCWACGRCWAGCSRTSTARTAATGVWCC
jgi:hypothetical protein